MADTEIYNISKNDTIISLLIEWRQQVFCTFYQELG